MTQPRTIDVLHAEFAAWASGNATTATTAATATVATMALAKDFAAALDAGDSLRHHRAAFHFPVKGDVLGAHGTVPEAERADPFLYLVGNSLGLQHCGVEASVAQELGKWRSQAVEGHFLQPNPWFEIDNIARADMAAVVGAEEDEVVLMNTLTCNLHLLMTAFYKPSGKRTKILSEKFPFPSDTHALVSQVQLHGYDPSEHYITVDSGTPEGKDGPRYVSTQRWLDAIEANGDTVAVLLIGAVHFLTGQLFDIAAITAAAHAKGIIVGVDAAHAVGNVPLALHDWNVDFACWCTYKYLNGGPGNIGGAFVHDRHTPPAAAAAAAAAAGDDAVVAVSHPTPLCGWWGHARGNRFALHRNFVPAAGAAAFQLSNPCVLSIASLVPSLRLFATITMPVLRAKSKRLTAYLEHLLLERIGASKIEILTPSAEEERGAQLSIRLLPNSLKSKAVLSAAYECGTNLGNDADIAQRQLLCAGVMCDNRPPDIIRVAPTPTYNSYTDVYIFAAKFSSLF